MYLSTMTHELTTLLLTTHQEKEHLFFETEFCKFSTLSQTSQ